MQPHQHLVIIGNGIAGITLAQQVRKKSNCAITLISAESTVHFSRPALMYVYMGHMRYQDIVPYAAWYYQEQQLKTIHDKVLSIDFKTKILKLENGDPVTYDVLVLATGSIPVSLDCPGIKSEGVQGLVTLQDLEVMEKQTATIKQAVIVGGGLIGVEMAEMLSSHGIEITMLVREKLFYKRILPVEEASLITRHIEEHGIKLLLQDELKEIIADKSGQVQSIETKNGIALPCQFVGVAIGVTPNVSFLYNSDLELDKGILVDTYFKSNLEDVYAIGDCAQFRNTTEGAPAIEQLWYTARKHAEALALTLTGTPVSYDRGPWFNSAKFLDIEYQTYGHVPAEVSGDKYKSLYWEHPDKTKAIRILFEASSEKLAGINLLGIRYRHDLCHHWLLNNYTIHQVMPELCAANFDTEFFRHYEPEILKQYDAKFPEKNLLKKGLSWWQLRERYSLYLSKKRTAILTDD